MVLTNRSSWRLASKWTSSCTTTYSGQALDFLASSRLIQIRRASGLHVPHFVFILLIPYSYTVTPSRFCHFSNKGGSRYRRYQFSITFWRASPLAPDKREDSEEKALDPAKSEEDAPFLPPIEN